MIKNQTIEITNMIVSSKGNIASDMDGEKVLLSIDNGKYYNLGKIGGEIWDAILKPICISQLITNLMTEFEVDQGTCEEQVIPFLEHLSEEGLIQIGE